MSQDRLRRDIERLRRELDSLAQHETETRRALDRLVRDLERSADKPEDGSLIEGLREDLRTAVARFEAKHPRATAILNDIMVTLANMGI
jgi:cell division protein FtsB